VTKSKSDQQLQLVIKSKSDQQLQLVTKSKSDQQLQLVIKSKSDQQLQLVIKSYWRLICNSINILFKDHYKNVMYMWMQRRHQ